MLKARPSPSFAITKRLTIDERLVLFRKVCAAVAYAHQNLVVHRDIKPSNILIAPDGEPKLLDFGIAKLLSPDWFGVTMEQTATGANLLTPEYASPEQIRGEKITTASDVFSLGVLLYELLSGHRPFRFKTGSAGEVLQVISERQPPAPSTAALTREEIAVDRRAPPDGFCHPTRWPKCVQRSRRVCNANSWAIWITSCSWRCARSRSVVTVRCCSLPEDVRRHLEGLPVAARPGYAFLIAPQSLSSAIARRLRLRRWRCWRFSSDSRLQSGKPLSPGSNRPRAERRSTEVQPVDRALC